MTWLQRGDEVKIDTDTVVDVDGIPVGIRRGAHGRFILFEGRFAEVIVWWTSGPELLGVPLKYVRFVSELPRLYLPRTTL